MGIHDAARAFDGAAAAYERGRPSYPAEAVAHLADRLGIRPGRTVVDLGAGTGKLTRLIVPLGARVVAVEPVAGMRAELLARASGVEVLDGTAEAVPLDDASADAATAAQAFHWFDGPRALAEIDRVLRPGGALGLIWNARDLDDPLQAALYGIIHRYRQGEPEYLKGEWRRAFDGDTGALFTPLEEHRTPYVQELDAEGVVDRTLSVSVVAAQPPDERARVADEIRALLADAPTSVALRHVTEVYVCSKRS